MKIKQTLLILILISTSIANAQTVKWWAGIQNDVEPEKNYNNTNSVAPANAYFYEPSGIGWDNNNNMWITEKNKIRLFYNGTFNNRGGNLGNATSSFGYQNKTGILSAFYSPAGIVSDASGALYIADEGNHAIRKMGAFVNTANGQAVTTFAGKDATGGTGEYGESGSVDGTGYAARFYSPKGMVRDAAGNFYVCDFDNYAIRKISATGVVTTLAGKLGVEGSIDGTGTDGSTARFSGPYGIAILNNSTLIVSDYFNGTIRTVNMSNGGVKTIAGDANDAFKQIDGSLISKARFYLPRGLVVVEGKVYVADRYSVRVIDFNKQTVSLFAGSYSATDNTNGVGSNARFGEVVALAYNFNANKTGIYVADHTYNVIKILNIDNLAPTVLFTADKKNAVINEVVTLKNDTSNYYTPLSSVKWTITPASYTVASGSLTSNKTALGIKFTATGFYNVRLVVTNKYGLDTLLQNNYIGISTIGIKEVGLNAITTAYPNPSEGLFTLKSLDGGHPILSFIVSDITGKVVFQKSCDNALSEDFDLSNCQKGFYFIKINSSAGSNTLKIQKL